MLPPTRTWQLWGYLAAVLVGQVQWLLGEDDSVSAVATLNDVLVHGQSLKLGYLDGTYGGLIADELPEKIRTEVGHLRHLGCFRHVDWSCWV